MTATPIGLCQCGCGGLAPLAKQSDTKRGHVKGQPLQFISGHNKRLLECKGRYRRVSAADSAGSVSAHLAIAARALGRPLPPGAEVHHVDGDGQNNAKNNLVICQDHAYHMLLHMRARIVKAGGDPNTQRVCGSCRLPKDFREFPIRRASSDGIGRRCRACQAIWNREYRRRKRLRQRRSA